MAGRIPEQTKRGWAPVPTAQSLQRTQAEQIAVGIGTAIVFAGTPIVEERRADNAIQLLEGEHGGFKLRAPGTVLRGAPGARVKGPVSLQSSATVSQVAFDVGVALTATARVVFSDCRFMLPITVEAGGHVRCIGCFFDGTAAITNAGVAANAVRIGCEGTSALAADLNVSAPIGGI